MPEKVDTSTATVLLTEGLCGQLLAAVAEGFPSADIGQAAKDIVVQSRGAQELSARLDGFSATARELGPIRVAVRSVQEDARRIMTDALTREFMHDLLFEFRAALRYAQPLDRAELVAALVGHTTQHRYELDRVLRPDRRHEYRLQNMEVARIVSIDIELAAQQLRIHLNEILAAA